MLSCKAQKTQENKTSKIFSSKTNSNVVCVRHGREFPEGYVIGDYYCSEEGRWEAIEDK